MSKTILHIDLNAFFVRCEEIKNPSLEGKPVIIGHSGRAGIVSTCSYAARSKGVCSGMPTFKAIALCPEAIVIQSGYHDYQSKSREFFSFLKKYAKIIEPASIDECFVDFTNEISKVKNPVEYLKQMQLSLYKETGLKCSIGVAPTRFLAKMASDMKKPMGLTIIRRKDARKMLDPFPIKDFFGIGKKTAPRLEEMGIKTIGDLGRRIDNEDPEIEKMLGKFYYVIKDWINGYGSDNVSVEPFDPKSIGHSTTFISNTNNVEDIKSYLMDLAKEVSDDAKKANKVGSQVQLVLKDTEFKVTNKSKRLSKKTNDFQIIYSTAKDLLENNFDGRFYRLCGVTLQNLIDPRDNFEQLSIFDNYDEVKEKCATRLLIGELNRQMNKTLFKTAGDALKEKR